MASWFTNNLAKLCLESFLRLSSVPLKLIACCVSFLSSLFGLVLYTPYFFNMRVLHISNSIKARIARDLRFYFAHGVRFPLNNNSHLKVVEGCFLFTWLQQHITRNAG